MLMGKATGVNAAPPRAIMLSIGDIAQRDGVSKPAVSRKVKQLVEQHGLTVERDGQERVARVNVAE
jgi:DNA-binding transcriptional ArsR family regulator